jgi:hypothetical protein
MHSAFVVAAAATVAMGMMQPAPRRKQLQLPQDSRPESGLQKARLPTL